MKVSESVRKAMDDWGLGERESAMMHACNAVDGTAHKLHPALYSKARFTRVLRDNYAILGPMGVPGIDLKQTRFPVAVERPTAADGKPDIADMLYAVHRCCHAHGDELPGGFDLFPDASGLPGHTRMWFEDGKVRLSDRVVFGLIAVAVCSTVNADQATPRLDGYHFTYGRLPRRLMINDLWGKPEDLLAAIATETVPEIKMDFGDWVR